MSPTPIPWETPGGLAPDEEPVLEITGVGDELAVVELELVLVLVLALVEPTV